MPKSIEDLTNRTYGLWNVLSRDKTKARSYFICKCKCGVIHSVRSDALKSGASYGCQSCASTNDLTGKVFGAWLVLKSIKQHNKLIGWLCRCQKCGIEKIVTGSNLSSGKTTQCRKCGTPRTHGASNTRLYGIYRHIMSRCYCVTNDSYSNYGARGITVCDAWKQNFMAFAEWAKTHGYEENLTIDRIDVNSGYSPDNCRWVTIQQQQKEHKRKLRVLTFNGQEKSVAEWARVTGLKAFTIRRRLNKGWPVEKALITRALTGPYAKQKNPA